MRFIDAPLPTEVDLVEVAEEVCQEMIRFLEKNGYIQEHADHELTATERWFLQGLAEPSGLMPTPIPPEGSGVEFRGFSVHAGVAVRQGDKRGRAQLARYVARPPFAANQLRLRPDGRIDLEVRSQARNGHRSITLESLQLMRRLAWLIPAPGRHQVL